MSVSAIVSMVLILTTVIGGFAFFLSMAIKRGTKK